VLVSIATHLPNLTTLGLSSYKASYTEVGAQALVTSLTQLKRFSIRPYDLSVFTPELRKRWQDASAGLEVEDNWLASTRYFEHILWYRAHMGC
jgi:hypothetical protein